MDWHPEDFMAKCEEAALDGAEEWAMTTWQSQAREDCPVGQYPAGSGRVGGTMRASLTVEREEDMIHMGGGGAAKSYIRKQELDRSLDHTSGKAGFILDSFEMHLAEIGPMVQERIDQL